MIRSRLQTRIDFKKVFILEAKIQNQLFLIDVYDHPRGLNGIH
jgi:hypothetical protein